MARVFVTLGWVLGWKKKIKKTGGEIERDVLNVCIVKNSGATPQSMGLARFGVPFLFCQGTPPMAT